MVGREGWGLHMARCGARRDGVSAAALALALLALLALVAQPTAASSRGMLQAGIQGAGAGLPEGGLQATEPPQLEAAPAAAAVATAADLDGGGGGGGGAGNASTLLVAAAGSAAAASLAMAPERLAAVAAAAGWEPEKVQQELAADPSLKLDTVTDRLFYACKFEGRNASVSADAAGPGAGPAAARSAAVEASSLSGLQDPPIDQAFKLRR